VAAFLDYFVNFWPGKLARLEEWLYSSEAWNREISPYTISNIDNVLIPGIVLNRIDN